MTEANAAQLFGRYLPNGSPTEIRTTVTHLGTQQTTQTIFDHAELIAEFAAIRDRISCIEEAKVDPTPGSLAWRPQPGWLCNFCRFADVCSYQASTSASTPLAWLHTALDLPL